MARTLDITSKDSVQALIGDLQAEAGRIDSLVNSAYPRTAEYGRPLAEVTYQGFCDNVSMHLGGYFLMCQQFGEYFRGVGAGNIVNVASVYGRIAPRFEIYEGTSLTMPVEYAAIKSAVIHLTRYFAQHHKGDGVRVNSLSPGGVLDGQPPAFVDRYGEHCSSGGMLDPQDLDGALLFLLSDASRTVTGQDLVVDDGFSL